MFTTTVKNIIMDAVFGGNGGAALPTGYYVGLSTTAPSADGNNISEPASSSGYVRLTVDFSEASGGKIQNSGRLEFPAFTEDAGVVTHYVIFDQNGAPFWFDKLARSRSLETESVLAFPAGSIVISLTDGDMA